MGRTRTHGPDCSCVFCVRRRASYLAPETTTFKARSVQEKTKHGPLCGCEVCVPVCNLPTGTTGPTGPASFGIGFTGPDGPTGGGLGGTGALGVTGPTGPFGVNGVLGSTGDAGVTGPTGSVGAPGATGDQGESGEEGVTGPTGADSAFGSTGPIGATGIGGPGLSDGPTGSVGSTGGTGGTGGNGVSGGLGPTGAIGPTGVGTIGVTGPTGPAGIFSSGPTVNEGNTGTINNANSLSGGNPAGGINYTPNTTSTITGFGSGSQGRTLTVFPSANMASGSTHLALAHEDVGSLAVNRMVVPEAGTRILNVNRSERLYYDDSGDRWRNQGRWDPSMLTAATYWQGNYSGGTLTLPWQGMPSRGVSAISNATQGTVAERPALGPPQNGRIPALFDGVNDWLNAAGQIANTIGEFTWSAAALVRIDAVTSNSITAYANAGVWADLSGFWGMYLRNNGAGVLRFLMYQWTGGAQVVGGANGISIPSGLGTWVLLQGRFATSVMEARVNGGAWTTFPTSLPNVSALSGGGALGRGNGAPYWGGRMLLAISSNTQRWTDVEFERLRVWSERRYNLLLP